MYLTSHGCSVRVVLLLQMFCRHSSIEALTWISVCTRVNVLGYFPALRGNTAINQPHDASGSDVMHETDRWQDRRWTLSSVTGSDDAGPSGRIRLCVIHQHRVSQAPCGLGEPQVRVEGVGLLLWCLRSVSGPFPCPPSQFWDVNPAVC